MKVYITGSKSVDPLTFMEQYKDVKQLLLKRGYQVEKTIYQQQVFQHHLRLSIIVMAYFFVVGGNVSQFAIKEIRQANNKSLKFIDEKYLADSIRFEGKI